MNILFSSPGFFPHFIGGGEMYVYHLVKELLRRGHKVTVLINISWEGGEASYTLGNYAFEEVPVVTFSLNPAKVSASEKHNSFGPVTEQALREILIKIEPDILHINGIKAASVSLCNKLNIPHVVTVHHTGIICPAGALLRTDGSICEISTNIKDCIPCCNFWRRPKWYTGGLLGKLPTFVYRPIGKKLNGSRKLSYIERGLIYSYLVEQSIEAKKMLIERTQHFIAPSLAMNDLLIRNGCDPKKITIMPHGIEILEKLPMETFDGRPVRFGYVGRVDRLKGLHVLLKALELLPDGRTCELHILGTARNPWDEEYRKKALANYHGKAKLLDHGLILPENLKEAYQNIDVLIVPSILPEAFGLVAAEGHSAGRPVIVSNSGALQEIVRNGIGGFVVERNDSKALAEAMQRFIDHPELIIQMSRQIPRVKTIEEYLIEIENVYKRVCQE